ncbi:MAG: GNAT family N-acetyltransferase [Christensenellaceae bacterium]
MKAALKSIRKERDFLTISMLAHEIWREHYAAIISSDQIEYMLEKYQTVNAIKSAIAGGYEYFLIKHAGIPIGYAGIKANEPIGKLFLSKFYLLKDYRGKGYAHDIIDELCEKARRLHQNSIWLTVNKSNSSIRAYEKLGFHITDNVCTDIGSGYFMDDYIMEKIVL